MRDLCVHHGVFTACGPALHTSKDAAGTTTTTTTTTSRSRSPTVTIINNTTTTTAATTGCIVWPHHVLRLGLDGVREEHVGPAGQQLLDRNLLDLRTQRRRRGRGNGSGKVEKRQREGRGKAADGRGKAVEGLGKAAGRRQAGRAGAHSPSDYNIAAACVQLA